MGTNDVLPNDAALCEPCDSACVVELDITTESTLISTTSISSSTYFKEFTEFSETTPKPTTPAEFKISTKMTSASKFETATLMFSSTYLTESTKKDGTVPILTTPADSMHHCVENMDRFDTKWNRTAENTLVILSCTGEYTGTVSRNCSNGGMWDEPDYAKCLKRFVFVFKLDQLLAGDSIFPLVSTILEDLENITRVKNGLRTGDSVTASVILEGIAKYNFGSICNDLLDEQYHQSWEELKDKGTSGVTAVVKAVTEYNSAFHNVLDGEFSMTVKRENTVMEVRKTSSDEISIPDRLQTTDSRITYSGTEMKLKKNMCSDQLCIIILTVYKMMTTKGLAKKTLEEKSRIGLKSICVILPLFGVTWVLGAFSVGHGFLHYQRHRKANRSDFKVSTDNSYYDTHKRQQRNSHNILAKRKEQKNEATYRSASQR
ncbi:unnamed protein product [Mytilus coruscus]|uniref:G-protein coupled receptors family 2 profile 1 domain-containing protein n=1 Tax=Mytilus coruscus TaxID=42192 RepID=A0A6J8B6I7_MYTCO|nr:unnamed protein product [Mytilus coruscus]